ncbi:flagellar export chaperone FliS [Georgenia thermotolerans]|uniref:Flagellar export chaperone FliS n=1 Tax=Georgenia thermotolerans TaxID=527326 RepID=A0A7J5UNX1_9MICO|nr:flagellar export chaperone FliS [Georgenia thermotolerans]KAE8764069.1 flagellar export chaperone FliS [Georgenia thermotolerans]
MNQAALLGRFRSEAVATATPAKLLTMLYDRLVLDLDRGIEALNGGDRPAANEQLTHAQEIIHELRSSLNVSAWEGARGLMDLYGYLLTELVGANIARDAARVTACRDLVVPLRDAWHQAASQVGSTGAPAAGAAAAATASGQAAAQAFAPAAPAGYQPLGDLGVA